MRSGSVKRCIGAFLSVLLGVTFLVVLEGLPVSVRARAEAEQAEVLAIPGVPSAPGQFYRSRGAVADALSIAAGATATVKVTGKAGVPASGVATVTLNIAVKGSAAADQLTVYPSDAAKPNTTFIRYRNDIYTQNLLTTKVGPDGNIKITNGPDTAVTIYADVHGHTLSAAGSTPGLTFVPLKPARIGRVSVPANGNYTLAPLGKAGIPASGVSDVMFTMVANSATAGKLTVHASGEGLPGDSNLDYGLGRWVQNHVWAKLGADGKVIINNAGPAVTVDLDASGYFVAAQAPVAGTTLKPLVSARLASDVSVAAGGTYSLAPLGRGGVPASGVSAVWINVTTYGGSNGAIRAYPSGTPATVTHVVTNLDTSAYSGSLPAKLGTDGKVILANSGSTAARIWVDVFGYFEPPSSRCAPTAPATAPRKAQAADPEPYSPTNVMQSAPLDGGSIGKVELAYADNAGYLVHGRAEPSALNSVQWTVVSTIDQQFTGRPALAEQADKKLQLLGHDTGNNVWTMTQTSREPAAWGQWTNANRPMASHVAVARHEDTLVAFAVDGAGELWALPQYEPNGGYPDWINLGLTGLAASGTPVAVPVASGVQVFALDASGAWRTAVYSRGSLSGCAALSGSGLSGTVSAVVLPGSRLQIFARGADGRVLTMKQDTAGAFPQNWEQVGDLVAVGSPSALISPVTRRMELLVRGQDNKIYSTGETFQGSGEWRVWKDTEATGGNAPATDPTAFQYTSSNGSAWAFVFRTQSNLHIMSYANESAAEPDRSTAPPEFTTEEMTKPPSTPR
ncbi:hypothetical protein ACFY4C_03280 [Actinomadura viridis]|uniref:hypothetical protein n=1 Tax=Actinomadura viridis TaxID=58110 RepID=UPI0036C89F89